jgi:hypothetical protein
MNAEVYTMTADGGAQTRLTAFHMDDWGPQWSPDGQTLAFLSNREMVDRVFLMNPDGSDQRRLTADKTPPPDPSGRLGGEPHETDPIYAPDGALAFCVRTGPGASLRLAEHGKILTLTDGAASDRNPSWSPDGQHLVFTSTRDGGDLELYRIDPRRPAAHPPHHPRRRRLAAPLVPPLTVTRAPAPATPPTRCETAGSSASPQRTVPRENTSSNRMLAPSTLPTSNSACSARNSARLRMMKSDHRSALRTTNTNMRSGVRS